MSEYNGWTNYETWNCKLWIDNEEGSYNYWKEQAEECYRQAKGAASDDDTQEEVSLAATDSLAQSLREVTKRTIAMKITQFNLADFNPDGMFPDEIEQWIVFIGQGVRPQVAHQWFPNVKGQYKLVKSLRAYLWNKKVAMDLRAKGNIASALQYESICERIYRDFPANIRPW